MMQADQGRRASPELGFAGVVVRPMTALCSMVRGRWDASCCRVLLVLNENPNCNWVREIDVPCRMVCVDVSTIKHAPPLRTVDGRPKLRAHIAPIN
ncbi:hypothetical protein L1887_32787 [Cichorium endivia]|nr:hypothetical protein L1887_32787 [Cichorium endivia]